MHGDRPARTCEHIGRFLMGNEEQWRLGEKRLLKEEEERWRLNAERLRQTGLGRALPGQLKQDGGFGPLPTPIETPGMELPGVADPMTLNFPGPPTPNLLDPSLSDLDPRHFLVMEQEKREREELEATEKEKERLRGLQGMYY